MQKETLDLLEERIVQNLNNMELHGIGSEERAAMTKETCDLVEKLNESERINLEAWDKEDRRELEREKNQNAVEIEKIKQNVTWKRAALQIGEKVIPVIVSGTIFGILGTAISKAEIDGRIPFNSRIGRILTNHLPRF